MGMKPDWGGGWALLSPDCARDAAGVKAATTTNGMMIRQNMASPRYPISTRNWPRKFQNEAAPTALSGMGSGVGMTLREPADLISRLGDRFGQLLGRDGRRVEQDRRLAAGEIDLDLV